MIRCMFSLLWLNCMIFVATSSLSVHIWCMACSWDRHYVLGRSDEHYLYIYTTDKWDKFSQIVVFQTKFTFTGIISDILSYYYFLQVDRHLFSWRFIYTSPQVNSVSNGKLLFPLDSNPRPLWLWQHCLPCDESSTPPLDPLRHVQKNTLSCSSARMGNVSGEFNQIYADRS